VTQKPELAFLQVFSNDNFASEHCLCQDGFVGQMCETKVEVCGDDNHVCLHGSKCLYEEKDGEYRCDCEAAFTPESRYAGKFCQHHHTDMCDPTDKVFDGTLTDMSFCVNDGVVSRLKNDGPIIIARA
jgi:EGF-like domain